MDGNWETKDQSKFGILYSKHTEMGHVQCLETNAGDKFYYLNVRYHRTDGPAMMFASGSNFWFLHGIQIECKTQEQFLKLIKLKAFW